MFEDIVHTDVTQYEAYSVFCEVVLSLQKLKVSIIKPLSSFHWVLGQN